MKINVLYFAWLRERLGRGEEEVSPPATVGTVGELMAWLATREAKDAPAFAASALIRAAVNQEFAGPDTRLSEGDEVAFFPPMTGG